MSAEKILERMEKLAKRDMPHFTDQNRPKKAKEIYKALERDHPDMPAEMKARIAGRQGKKGHQKQGPPYTAPIKKWKEKKASISYLLNDLWDSYGRTEELEKNAAADYFYRLQKPTLDSEALGASFCKLAYAFDRDPWDLAGDVEDHLDSFSVLAKTASGRQQELAQFYINWVDGMLKRAGVLGAAGKMLGGAAATATRGVRRARGLVGAPQTAVAASKPTTAFGRGFRQSMGRAEAKQGVTMAANPRTAQKQMRRQMAAQETAKRQAATQAQAAKQQAIQQKSVATPQMRADQAELKKNIIAKRQAAGQALPKGVAPQPKKGVLGSWTPAEKIIGGTALGATALGAGALANSASGGRPPQQQPAYGY